MQPDVRYARSGGAAIAHQVVGQGNVDLVSVPDGHGQAARAGS